MILSNFATMLAYGKYLNSTNKVRKKKLNSNVGLTFQEIEPNGVGGKILCTSFTINSRKNFNKMQMD